jgi:hypothetical protein
MKDEAFFFSCTEILGKHFARLRPVLPTQVMYALEGASWLGLSGGTKTSIGNKPTKANNERVSDEDTVSTRAKSSMSKNIERIFSSSMLARKHLR